MLEKIKHLIKKNKNEKKQLTSSSQNVLGNTTTTISSKKNRKLSKSTSNIDNKKQQQQIISSHSTTNNNCTIVQSNESHESIESIQALNSFRVESDLESENNIVENDYDDNINNTEEEEEEEEDLDHDENLHINNNIRKKQIQIVDIKIPNNNSKSSFLRTVSSQLINITKNLKSNNNSNSNKDDGSQNSSLSSNNKLKDNNDDDEEQSQDKQQQQERDESEFSQEYYDDEEEYNDEDFEEDYVGLKEVENDYQKNFNCLSPNQLVEHQHKEIKDIAELFSINIQSSTSLLKFFNWKREVLISKYFESPKDVLKDVGIDYNSAIIVNNNNVINNNNITTTTTTTTTTSNNFIFKNCTICGDDYGEEDITMNQCKHYFCNDCWAGYLTSKINEGEAMLRCPHHKCSGILEDQIIQRLVAPFIYEKYLLFSTKKFIQQNQTLRYCPTPGCDNAITLKTDSSDTAGSESVQCSCGYKFCFKCHRESHAPATCDQMSQWEVKCQDESEVSHWKVANCKKCPKCQVAIEKNGGCMHITCVKCQYEWCWMCSRSWKGHNDFYVCNRFNKEKESKRFLFFGKKKKESSEEEERKASQQELERYLHYYERFVSHENSRKLENVIREEAKRKMEELEKANSTWAEVQFIEKGIDQLLDCRNILKFTYIFAFFSFTPPVQQQQRIETAKELFEFLQEDLEKTTERLSELMEDIMKKSISLEQSQRLEIMNYITFAKSKKEGLLNAISKDSLFEF